MMVSITMIRIMSRIDHSISFIPIVLAFTIYNFYMEHHVNLILSYYGHSNNQKRFRNDIFIHAQQIISITDFSYHADITAPSSNGNPFCFNYNVFLHFLLISTAPKNNNKNLP